MRFRVKAESLVNMLVEKTLVDGFQRMWYGTTTNNQHSCNVPARNRRWAKTVARYDSFHLCSSEKSSTTTEVKKDT